MHASGNDRTDVVCPWDKNYRFGFEEPRKFQDYYTKLVYNKVGKSFIRWEDWRFYDTILNGLLIENITDRFSVNFCCSQYTCSDIEMCAYASKERTNPKTMPVATGFLSCTQGNNEAFLFCVKIQSFSKVFEWNRPVCQNIWEPSLQSYYFSFLLSADNFHCA